MANQFTLEAALRHFGKTRADLLDYKVYEDKVVLIVVPGPKLVYDAAAIAKRGRPEPAQAEAEARPPEPTPDEGVKATEAAREMAGQLGIDLSTVEASGPGGKISIKDVERAARARASE